MNLKQAIPFRIQPLCDKKGITVYSLAISSGIDISTVYSILWGESKSPEVATIKNCATALT